MYRYVILIILIALASCVPEPDSRTKKRYQYLLPGDDFIIRVKTDNGVMSPTEFTIPTSDEATYNYDVDCNDDGINEATNQTGDYTCDYAPLGGTGTYTIRIKNTFPRALFGSFSGAKLISVEQWGSQQWTSFQSAFSSTSNLAINALDVPDLTNVTDLSYIFSGSGIGNGSGNWAWDTSGVTDMTKMFRRTENFNKDINGWDVSNVTTMEGMFSESDFNADISGWDVSRVTNMLEMFSRAKNFNADIGMWNVGAVETMEYMFLGAESFNQDIGQWDVSKVINFYAMFNRAIAFNQDIGGWDVTSSNSFRWMFRFADSFNQDLSSWNMETAEYAASMFYGANLSTQNYDAILTGWATQNLKPNVPFSVGSTYYCNGESARNQIVSQFNWTISDAGKKCSVFVEMDANSEDAESAGANLPMILALGTLETPTTVVVLDSNFGDAQLNFDYRFTSPQTVTIPPGTYDGTRATGIAIPTLQILDDNIVEEDETIRLSVSQPTANAELKDANGDGVIFTLHTYTILNDDICTDDAQCQGLTICNLKQNPAQCAEPNACGNGKLEAGEFCDDGNVELADGCNADCKIENGGQCAENDGCESGICDATNVTPVCEAVDTCGNNILETDEVCDDGNIMTDDGCDSLCIIEENLNCVGNNDCAEGLVCADGLCVVECRSNTDCQNGDCIFGQCVTCTKDEDCNGSDQCQDGGCVVSCTTNDECGPQGFCDGRCVECLESEDCLENEICTSGVCDDPNRCDPNLETCENTCTSNAECSDARIPFCDTDNSVCGECNSTQDCEDSEICVKSGTTNRCEPRCTADSCGDEVCGDNGFCGEECQTDADCAAAIKCDLDSNKCEKEDTTKDIVDEGCGCASSTPNIPLTPLIFCIFVAIVGLRRKVTNIM